MLLVFAAHFRETYFAGALDEAVPWALGVLTKVGTPAFLLISGMMIGFLHSGPDPGSQARLRAHLADRALFLLVAARPLIALAHAPRDGWYCLDYVYVTDMIAACVLAGCVIAPRVGARGRAVLGLALVALTWIVVELWNPPAVSLRRVLKDALFAFERGDALVYAFPLVPWLGLYLVGSSLGDRLGRSPLDRIGRDFFRIGLTVAATAFAAKVLYWTLSSGVPGARPSLVARLTSPLQKEPPGPAYLAFYGAIALLLIAAFLALESAGRLATLRHALARLGRASLFAFVAQYYVYYVGLYLAASRPSAWWPLVLAVTAGFLWAVAALWESRGYNRFLTLRLASSAMPAPADLRRREGQGA